MSKRPRRLTVPLASRRFRQLEKLADLEKRSMAKQAEIFIERGLDEAVKEGKIPEGADEGD